MDTPLSQSNVSLKLAEIQKRCAELMDGEADDTELTLEESTDDDAADRPGRHCNGCRQRDAVQRNRPHRMA